MKATGIVRRIDDLGRVVIPKEIRRTMRIREGDPLEIYTDRDAVIAGAGVPKREYTDRKLSSEFESIIEARTLFTAGAEEIPIVDGSQCFISCAMPIITDGDITGCVASVLQPDVPKLQGNLETKLIQTAAGFLGRQLEG